MRIDWLSSPVLKPEMIDRQKSVKTADFAAVLNRQSAKPASLLSPKPIPSSSSNQHPILLGTISRENPTVSNLLIKHPQYGKKCWNIIHSAVNRHKPFNRIQAGTTVYLDPQTLEITWPKGYPKATQMVAPPALKNSSLKQMPPSASDGDRFSDKFLQALHPFKDRSYMEMNCYELLIKGLKKCGVQYHGRGGLKEKLIQMAVRRGRPQNSYLTGEGLVKAAGTQLYTRKLNSVENPLQTAEKIYTEIRPHLKQGAILSFSTPSRGHTGIVSRHNDLWTYINSGRMDHRVHNGNIMKGVGEESLREEIHNWSRLAAQRQESLQITLGRLSEKKLAGYSKAAHTIAS